MAEKLDEKELWVDWTHDAAEFYVRPEDVDNNDDAADDMVDFTTKYADSMLDELEERYGRGTATKSRRKRRKTEDDE